MPGLNSKVSASLGTGASLTLDVPVTGMEYLHVITQVGAGAAVQGDNGTKTLAYLVNSGAGSTATLDNVPVPLFVATSLNFAGTIAWVHNLYAVEGLDKVQVVLTNNNAGALPARIDVFGS